MKDMKWWHICLGIIILPFILQFIFSIIGMDKFGTFIFLFIGASAFYLGYKHEYIDREKNKAVKFYNEGLVLSKSEDYEKALAAYNQALIFNDKDPDIWNNKCYVLTKLGKFDDAVKAGNVAVQLSPQDPEILDTLCNAYIGCNNREKTDECQKKVLELRENSNETRREK